MRRTQEQMLRRRPAALLLTILALGGLRVPAHASQFDSDPVLRAVDSLLKASGTDLDLAKAKVTIDHLVDPSVDVKGTLQQLDAMAARIKARFPPDASNRIKLDILLSSLYQPGPWNDNRPFSYDFDDPFGRDLNSKMLSTYLRTRKGNCVSMPILFAIVGQKVGLNVTLATAPNHLLVKYLADDGEWMNVEATGGGFKFDTSYERETGISKKAISNKIYLRPLNPRESVAAMSAELMEFYGQEGQQERRIGIADLALRINPKDVVAMLHRSAGDYLLLQDRFVRLYPRPDLIPSARRAEYQELSRDNLLWMAKAEELGWTAPTDAQEKQYLDTIKQHKVDHGDVK